MRTHSIGFPPSTAAFTLRTSGWSGSTWRWQFRQIAAGGIPAWRPRSAP